MNLPEERMYIPNATTMVSTEAHVQIQKVPLKRGAYFRKQGIHNPVQDATENLVAHQDGKVEIANDHGTGKFDSIRKMT
jgi:hypothetical protein